eukprot:gene1749-2905_t
MCSYRSETFQRASVLNDLLFDLRDKALEVWSCRNGVIRLSDHKSTTQRRHSTRSSKDKASLERMIIIEKSKVNSNQGQILALSERLRRMEQSSGSGVSCAFAPFDESSKRSQRCVEHDVMAELAKLTSASAICSGTRSDPKLKSHLQ